MGVCPTWNGPADAESEEWSKGDFTLQIKMQGWPALVTVKSLRYQGVMHWIFWDGKRFHDPSGVEQIERYEITDIFPLTYMTDPTEGHPWADDLPERWEDSCFPPEAMVVAR